MTFNEYLKEKQKTWGIGDWIVWYWEAFINFIYSHHLWPCPHDATLGRVGVKEQICIVCGKTIATNTKGRKKI